MREGTVVQIEKSDQEALAAKRGGTDFSPGMSWVLSGEKTKAQKKNQEG